MKHLTTILITFVSFTLMAAEAPKPKDKKLPEAKVYQSEHSITLGGNKLKYQATAGTLLIKNKKDDPIALFGFTAYVKNQKSSNKRPIVFAYNGGPGSSSIWLHMGVLGPQRAVIKDTGFTNNGPFNRVKNDYSIIDNADLVMIDPIGTGFSKFIGKGKGEDFWGVDQDINSVGNFIAQYVTENKRWASPKYILGESYGGMRSAGLSLNLLNKHNMALNGIILVSPFLDFNTGFDFGGIDLPHVLFLPTFAITAYYHKALPNQPKNRDEFLAEVEAFASGEYAHALFLGNKLPKQERTAVVDKLYQYTGISKEYWERANLRVGHQQFTKELMRTRNLTTGRIDSRFKGFSIGGNGDTMSYDPMTTAIGPPYLAAFMDYYSNDLKVPPTQTYQVSGDVFEKWDWSHAQPGTPFKLPSPNTVPDLSVAMIQNPHMKVLFLQGYFDLATPYYTTKYLINHLQIPDEISKNISSEYYEAGHMMYVHKPSLIKFKKDLDAFIKMSH